MQIQLTVTVEHITRVAQGEMEIAALALDASFKQRENWNRLLKLVGFLEGMSWINDELAEALSGTLGAAHILQDRYRNSNAWASAGNGAVKVKAVGKVTIGDEGQPVVKAPDGRSNKAWMRVNRSRFAPVSKLDEKRVLEIFDMAWAGFKAAEIAKLYSISHSHVYLIKTRRAWRQLLDEQRPAGALPPPDNATHNPPDDSSAQ